jgi:hypothetical protein
MMPSSSCKQRMRPTAKRISCSSQLRGTSSHCTARASVCAWSRDKGANILKWSAPLVVMRVAYSNAAKQVPEVASGQLTEQPLTA